LSVAAAVVHVWDLSHAPTAPNARWACTTLSPAELERAASLQTAEHRQRFVISHALMRHTAAEALGEAAASVQIDQTCPRCRRPHGKPRLLDHPAWELSLSHAGDLVAVLLVRGRGGVDVELTGRAAAAPHLATRAFTAAERLVLAGLGHDPALATWFWTAKEATIKAYGALVPHLGADFADSSKAFHEPLRPRRWHGSWYVTAFAPAPGYTGAIVVDVPAIDIRYRSRLATTLDASGDAQRERTLRDQAAALADEHAHPMSRPASGAQGEPQATHAPRGG
jgi:4'-phosphopantetheinyl transferase